MPGQRKEGQRMLTVWLDRELLKAMQKRAEERGETIADFIRRASKRYIRPTRKGTQP